MLSIQSALRVYLPYFGHFLMAIGYILEQFENVAPAVTSGVVLLGHLCVLSDPRALSPHHPKVQMINIIFLLSNIIVFIYDITMSLDSEIPVEEMANDFRS